MATFTPDINNNIFQLAIQLVNQSNRTIFLTGKAGTGKTTFLKYIRDNSPKQMAIVAPTGVAAINAGGVTIHSFFQLPLEPFLPEPTSRHQLISRLRFNSEKKKMLRQLELLVIDEISMVRSDLLDAIDTVLRFVRQRPQEKFGGVQVLFIGDLLQLPPVIKEQEWRLLAEYYDGIYFFDSLVLKESPPVYIEFEKIYRQRDEAFIRVLNQVRNNELDTKSLAILEKQFDPIFRRKKNDGFIILTTHNHKANDINARELREIQQKLFSYPAEVEDEFAERAFPADELLQLKKGAQVMFIRNDTAENGKRFFNGKIGIVSRLEENKIYVQCRNEETNSEEEIEVKKEKWENVRYTIDKKTRQLQTEVLGSFTQFPLRLAWAITIHKSQGLTFDKAIIDAGQAFAAGQVYVALSRCTNLKGMILQSHIQTDSLFTDPRIVAFSQQNIGSEALKKELAIAKKQYQQSVLTTVFDFQQIIQLVKELSDYQEEQSTSFNKDAFSWMENLIMQLETQQETAAKFQLQIADLFQQDKLPEENKFLQERIQAAAQYFIPEIQSIIDLILQTPVVTDSSLHAKHYNENLKDVFARLSGKKFMLEGFHNKFDMEAFHRRQQKFEMPRLAVNTYAGASSKRNDSPHPVLHQQLRKLRDKICAPKNLPIYIVAGSATLDEMARYLPQTTAELKKINGFGDVKVEKYGEQFLAVIHQYTAANGLSSLIHEKKQKKEHRDKKDKSKKKVDTYAVSLALYKEGKSIAEIAAARRLTTGTIEKHFTKFIREGLVPIDSLLSEAKQQAIQSALKKHDNSSITFLKQQLSADISYGEIRWVLAGVQFEKERN